MRKFVGLLAAALLLGTTGQAMAQKNAIRLMTTLVDASVCGSQRAGDSVAGHSYVAIGTNIGYKVELGDRLVYDVLIPNESTLNAGAVDLIDIEDAAGGGTLRDSNAKDQFGIYAHPATDLTQTPKLGDGTPIFQRGKWHHREIVLGLDREFNRDRQYGEEPLDQLGGTIGRWFVAIDLHDSTHRSDVCPTDKANPRAIALFRNINIVGADGKVKKALYNGEAKLPDGQQKFSGTNGGYGPPDTIASVDVEVVPDPAP
jgi:hypothetical protein